MGSFSNLVILISMQRKLTFEFGMLSLELFSFLIVLFDLVFSVVSLFVGLNSVLEIMEENASFASQ